MPTIKPEHTITECIRCGTCCKKGGPAFHLEDKLLIEQGAIPSKHLYTIRNGEPSYDNIKGYLILAASDIIKIKAHSGNRSCRFFNETENGCEIYDFRPLECRVLKCWDTRDIEKMYSLNRLTRKDLVSNVKGLWELIDDHQQRCSYHHLKHLAGDLHGNQKDKASEEILAMIAYDTSIRQLVVQKGGLDPELTDFLFGRPLVHTIGMYGFKVDRNASRLRISPFRATPFPLGRGRGERY